MTDYPDFEKTCGYGDVTGILGANCRHSYYAFVEGIMEPLYTEEQLEAMKPENRPKITYDGKEYDDYQATQMQRRLEREIRKQKRRVTAYKAAGLEDDATAAGIRLRRLNTKYNEFSKAAGLPRQIDRMRVEWSDEEANNYTNSVERGIIDNRSFAMGLRKPASYILTEEEIQSVKADAKALEIDEKILRFNEGSRTGYDDRYGIIYICGDVLPDIESTIARDRMSSKAVLAHEYYGHCKNDPSEYDTGDWRDEFRASYDAAINAPNLSDEERKDLMVDAYDRAREAGHPKEYDAVARRLIYGYEV